MNFKLRLISVLLLFSIQSLAIVGGQKASKEDIVSQSTVGLFTLSGQPFCTGTLITRGHVLTAAHCNPGSNNFLVGFGTDKESLKVSEVQSFLPHPNYSPSEMKNFPENPANDIAIVKLTNEAPDEYSPALPFTGTLVKGDDLVLAGFGRTGFFNSSPELALRFVNTVFQEELPASLEFTFGPTPGKSACKGDSGGPAYVFEGENALLLGVTSRGMGGRVDSLGRSVGCVGEGFYTDVRKHLSWIRENL